MDQKLERARRADWRRARVCCLAAIGVYGCWTASGVPVSAIARGMRDWRFANRRVRALVEPTMCAERRFVLCARKGESSYVRGKAIRPMRAERRVVLCAWRWRGRCVRTWVKALRVLPGQLAAERLRRVCDRCTFAVRVRVVYVRRRSGTRVCCAVWGVARVQLGLKLQRDVRLLDAPGSSSVRVRKRTASRSLVSQCRRWSALRTVVVRSTVLLAASWPVHTSVVGWALVVRGPSVATVTRVVVVARRRCGCGCGWRADAGGMQQLSG